MNYLGNAADFLVLFSWNGRYLKQKMSGQTMRNDEALAELMQFQRDTEALKSIAGRLAWDQETMMPKALQISEQQNTLR